MGAIRDLAVRLRALPLFWQIFVPSAVVLAAVAAILALTPAHVSSRITSGQTLAVLVALVAIVLINLLVIRRAVAPVERLTQLMARIDPLEPGERATVSGGSAETKQLAEVFNAMLERLESERRDSAARMLSAEEGERVRLARELHDEIGQTVTGLMLEIDQVATIAPPELEGRLRETQETAREVGSELRAIVRRLRPEALDDLGLHSALVALTERLSDQTSIAIERRLAPGLPALSPEAELVVYRVTQESLTNIVRHAGASRVVVELGACEGGIELRVSDDGGGLNGAHSGSGFRGMRERAVLAGGRLAVGAASGGGAEVTLRLPAGGER